GITCAVADRVPHPELRLPAHDALPRPRSLYYEGNVPFITVAIPTYRRVPMLRRAVESVFAQTFTDWEMVISDDEMPPGDTWKFLEALARSDGRVRPVMNGAPSGATFNHNTALKNARGEWVKILHDDDVLMPHCLEVLAEIVKDPQGAIA